MATKDTACPRCGATLQWDAQHARWQCTKCNWTDRPHGPARLDEILPALLEVPAESRSASALDLSMRLEVGMTPPRRRPDPDEVETTESLEDRRVIKAVLAGAAILLFLLVVAGWL